MERQRFSRIRLAPSDHTESEAVPTYALSLATLAIQHVAASEHIPYRKARISTPLRSRLLVFAFILGAHRGGQYLAWVDGAPLCIRMPNARPPPPRGGALSTVARICEWPSVRFVRPVPCPCGIHCLVRHIAPLQQRAKAFSQ